MHYKKKFFIRVIFLAEIALFVYGYVWGSHGMMNLYGCKKANMRLLQELENERRALRDIEQQIEAWNSDPFYKEQYARENLHMARAGEIMYVE